MREIVNAAIFKPQTVAHDDRGDASGIVSDFPPQSGQSIPRGIAAPPQTGARISQIRPFSENVLQRSGSSPTIAVFAKHPKTPPHRLRGGNFNPAAISIHAEQCAIICATVISGPTCFR
jgi:hypothetical protein